MKLSTAVLLTLAASLSIPVQAQTQTQQTPVTLRSILLHQLQSTHNKADWFAPVNTAVEGLTAEQAAWQPPNGSHSAGQLAYHLLYWNRRSLERLKGETPEKYNGDNNQTFAKFDEKQWADTVKQLDQVMTDIEQVVSSVDDQKLASIAPMVSNICNHNAYHTGQIVYVRKLQGSWNPEKGVK
jgi:uncharacterized damage-inducible protein DinB